MIRRHALRLTGCVAMAARAPLLWAQNATRLRRVGVLAPSTRAREEVFLKPFFDEMHHLGWIEGQTIVYDRAYAADQQRDLPRLAAELVARTPELIFAPPLPAAIAARQATGTIPIVFGTGTDPVGAGLVSSLAHPGGNVTGVLSVIDSLAPKRVQLLREVMPAVNRIGLLGDPTDARFHMDRKALAPVAKALGLTIVVGEASNPVEFDAAVAWLMEQKVDVIYAAGAIATNLRGRLIELADQRRVPVIGGVASMAEAGALFAYGASIPDQLRRSAQLVVKVLKGAKPADIPIEQPTKFELVINRRSAGALGLTIPQSLLMRADGLIE